MDTCDNKYTWINQSTDNFIYITIYNSSRLADWVLKSFNANGMFLVKTKINLFKNTRNYEIIYLYRARAFLLFFCKWNNVVTKVLSSNSLDYLNWTKRMTLDFTVILFIQVCFLWTFSNEYEYECVVEKNLQTLIYCYWNMDKLMNVERVN